MLKLENVFSNPTVLKKSHILLKIRIWLFSLAFLHLLCVALKLLTIDFNQAGPKLQIYQTGRWKLITSWFNLLTLGYLPVCVYCDWREMKGYADLRHVKILNQIRYICFSSILLPTTAFADTLFWRLWNKDRELIAPHEVDEIVPFWTQHSMHTVSLVVILLDLVLVPRQRPKSIVPGLVLTSAFLTSYISVCYSSIMTGEYVYPILVGFSNNRLLLLVVYVYLEHFFYYTSQWLVVDMIWGEKVRDKKVI